MVGEDERAGRWWEQLKQWEKDEVTDWWFRPELGFPLSSGMKQTAAGLGAYVEGELSEAAKVFLRTRFGDSP